MAPPKVIVQLYPMLPAEDEFDRARKRPLGRNRELYNRVLHDWMDIVNAAEELGVWGASSIEHHLHSEGYEVGPNPGVINAWWAGQVRRINIGAMGYVMSAQDPIRVMVVDDAVVMLGYRDSGMAGTEANTHPQAFCQANLDLAVKRLVELIRPSTDVDNVLESKNVMAAIDLEEFAKEADPEFLKEVVAR